MLAATPQIRNRATLGGNLLQRPRCWYYRDPDIDCWLKGGDRCPARAGRNEHHAIFPQSACVAVHPSDLATCLLALDASVDITSGTTATTMPIATLYSEPTEQRRTETTLQASDVISSICIPVNGLISTYRKAMDRKAWAFALVGVAAAARFERDLCVKIRIALTGVASTPRRAEAAEEIVSGGRLTRATIEQAALAVVDGAQPLSENRYKLQLAVALTRDALAALADRHEQTG